MKTLYYLCNNILHRLRICFLHKGTFNLVKLNTNVVLFFKKLPFKLIIEYPKFFELGF